VNRVALKMLIGDRAKYLSLVLGLSFAVLLIAQQTSIFFGLLQRSTGFLQNTRQPDLWVMDPAVSWVGEARPLKEQDLLRVRSTPGIAWAEPFFASRAVAELPDGGFATMRLFGVDRSTLLGLPPRMAQGNADDLRIPDAIVIAEASRDRLPGVELGDMLRLNDRRAVVVGFVHGELGFQSDAVAYTTFSNALGFVPTGRDRLTYVVAGVQEGVALDRVSRRIEQRLGLKALPGEAFRTQTIDYVVRQTGIGVNFGITVLLGFVVGLIVAAATFYQFTIENLRQLAVLKAMGATRWLLVRMILLQAMLVAGVGFGIGVGLASLFSVWGRQPAAELSTYFPWPLLVAALLATVVCVSAGSLLSLRRVLKLEPAIVFN
jgi:putative ABC transport system permease protein